MGNFSLRTGAVDNILKLWYTKFDLLPFLPKCLWRLKEMKIKITASSVSMEAELNDSDTAKKIAAALPIEAKANTWGDEIYFSIPVQATSEPDASPEVEMGDLAYWPPGNAFCIFFGMTPASSGNQIRAASAVNIVGKLLGNPEDFKKVKSGTNVKIEEA